MEVGTILDLELVVMGLTGTILFGLASKKQPELRRWLYVFILSTAGLFSNSLRNYFEIFNYFQIILYSISILLSSIIVFKEYMAIFRQEKTPNIFNGLMFFETIFAISFLSIATILLLIVLVLQVRITLEKRSFTYGGICLVLFSALLTIFGNIFITLDIPSANTINLGIDLFFTSTLLLSGIISIFENKVRESEIKYHEYYNRASFYKDLVSHDMSNILQTIRSSSELIPIYLKDKDQQHKIEELSKIIEQQINRGDKLVKNVRILSKAGDSKTIMVEVDIIEILKKCIENFKRTTVKKKIEIGLNSKFESIIIKGNDLLEDVFENIIGNAIKHNDDSVVKISINVEKLKSSYKIEFKDNGIGIPNHLKEKIFLASYKKQQDTEGMGIGLSLVKRIIESYNGNIWVEDRTEKNYPNSSNFIITLPISESSIK